MSHDDDHPDALEDRGRLIMYCGDPYDSTLLVLLPRILLPAN